MSKFIKIDNVIKPFKKKIQVNGDKSISIRSVLLASQAIGKSKIYNLLESEDVINSLKCIEKLGIKYKKIHNYYEIYGFGLKGYNTSRKLTINAGNSGTLARLILGLLVDSKKEIKIIGDKSLSKRDFSRVTEPLKFFGANLISKNKRLPVKIKGSNYLRPIKYEEKLGSAQCKSAVMLAALKTPGTTKIKARKSRNHTEIFFKNLKVPTKIKKTKNNDLIEVKGLHNFKAFNYRIPGDISSCSFFIVLTILTSDSSLTIQKINTNNTRIGIIRILKKMNANIQFVNRKIYKNEPLADIKIKSTKNLRAINCPKSFNSSAIDEFLLIFLIAARAKGVSKFYDLKELNNKESPRLNIAIKFLRNIGIKVDIENFNIKIHGNPKLSLNGDYIIKDFMKDHRVFMMSCIAALTLGGNWYIHDTESIKTSFPNFLSKIKSLGGKIN